MTDFQTGDKVKISFEGVVRYVDSKQVHVEVPGLQPYRTTYVPKDSVIEVLERGVYTDPVGTIRQPKDGDHLYIATRPPNKTARWLLLGTTETYGDQFIIELNTFVLDHIVAREVEA